MNNREPCRGAPTPAIPCRLRSNAVELARAWKLATVRDVNKVTTGGLVEGRHPARALKLRGADKGTQKIVHALLTGYLLHQLTGDKTYREFSEPKVA